ncbi:hypothetical protein M427DRAFT_99284 [Gonapodya prolifera JEL478]|uniref:Transcription factor n=1 Tax=Gonapodya prolifera (strain JEL478) TaxID=1344416 RepID=A0A139ADA5_GONPJ|nr:hypothetical protein M427DRAFT_99284 [Gonapodya prolifera JEL478]|eukprot:KXS14781.1 hypothetical protein M427DRAFT_99284 [Gonapodya prolifera JEL478]
MSTAAPASSTAPSQRAFVKQVVSCDTVTLRGKPTANGPPPEKLFSFSNIVAPRLGNAKEPAKEEPHAFQSREELRRLLVGREVAYRVDYTTSTNKREFGVLYLPPNQAVGGENNVSRIAVQEGWVKAKPADAKSERAEEQTYLVQLEAQAQIAQKGIWEPEATSKTREVRYDLSKDESKALLDRWKGKEVDAVIEQIRDGSTYRVLFIPPAGPQVSFVFQLAGVRSPVYRKDVPGVEDLVEPFSEEARYFVEQRLLQRDVKVRVEGLAQNGTTFVGSVVHPKGDISEVLLQEGFAKIQDWSLPLRTLSPAPLRAAETAAKNKRLRLWRDHVPKPSTSRGEFDATVIRIVSGEALEVEPEGKEGAIRKLWLSSLRQPTRPASAGKGVEGGYNYETKEFLRTKLIGRKVHVTVDYVKPPQEGFPEERECATITVGGQNVAELVLARGLGTVVRHRKDDDDRSPHLDVLQGAEAKALEQKKGVHSGKELPVVKRNDASENVNKAKQFLGFWKRSKGVPGVVEFVANAGRYRVYIPKENCSLTFVLAGVRAQRPGRPGTSEKPEPFADVATTFASRRTLQRDVELEVENVDKVGGFIGNLLVVTPAGERVNIGRLLLEEGLATVNEYSAEQSARGRELVEAEKKAKEAKKGIWSLPESQAKIEAETEAAAAAALVAPGAKDDGLGGREPERLYVQVVDGGVEGKLEKLMEDLNVGSDGKGVRNGVDEYKPKNNEIVAGRYTSDDQWYRAKVRRANTDKTYDVLYIDYGNSETLPASRIRHLPADLGVNHLPAQARECKLAYIKVPAQDEDYGDDAYQKLRSTLEGRELSALVVSKVVPPAVILFDPKAVPSGKKDASSITDVSVNAELVRDGLSVVEKAWVKRSAGTSGPVSALVAAMDDARKAHVSLK